MTLKRIAILGLPDEGSVLESGYLIQSISNFWREEGHEVVGITDLKKNVSADIAIVHLDQTKVPTKYLDYANRYPIVINGRCGSIRKDIFSHALLSPESDYTGRVIVKTKDNFGGYPEKNRRRGWQKLRHKISRVPYHARKQILKLQSNTDSSNKLKRHYWKHLETLNPLHYPILENIEQVPEGAWDNPNLIIEKYQPETDTEGRNILRNWYFFGNRNGHEIHVSRTPIVKYVGTGEQQELYEENMKDPELQQRSIPRVLVEARKALNLDYGRIDWAVHEGKTVIYDINKTPFADYVPFGAQKTGSPFEALTFNISKGLCSLIDT
ncbi:MAG: hypothetical protein O3C43_20705 [Verrucomicrobia bacterium]|nr:hypothetical protein [Verrucomicrobiota bacterium]